MNPVEPIRDLGKLIEIKRKLRRANPRNYLLFVLGVNTALRISDLLALHVNDVIDENRTVRQFLILREKKRGKHKRIKLNEAATEAIEFFLEQTKPEHSEFLFKNAQTGKAISRVQAWRLINAWARAVGITDLIGTHSMRKSWGLHARKSGVSLELIQKKLGHSSPSVTERYIGITADEIEAVENQVNL